LGCGWLVVLKKIKIVWGMGFVDGFFVVYYFGGVVCRLLLIYFVIGGEHGQLWEATNAR